MTLNLTLRHSLALLVVSSLLLLAACTDETGATPLLTRSPHQPLNPT